MKNTDHNKASADNLRRKAEDQINNKPTSSDPSLSEGDAFKLLHELQVHQIELVMQNEELMEAQKRAEDAINLYDSAPTGFFTLSKDGTIIRANMSGAAKLHKERESLKGSKFGFFVSDDTKEIFNTFLQNIFSHKSKETCEINLFSLGYTPINVILTGISGKEEDQCFITSSNITKLKEYEVTLQHERELYQDLVNNQPAGIYRIRVFQKGNWWNKSWDSSENPPYRMEFASDRFCEILEITRQEFETNPAVIVDLIHPEDKQEFIIKNEEANTNHIPFKWDGRLVIREKIRWIHLESIPHVMPGGEILWTGILYDTTDQELKEEELKESEIKYRDLVDNSPDAISIYSEGKVVFVNNECLRLLAAKSADELLGKSVVDFIHPDSRLLVFERMQDVAKEHNIQPLTEEKFLRLDGTSVDVEVKSMPIMFQNKKAVQLIVRDITENKKAEKELSKSQEEYKDLFDNAPVGYHEIDTEGRILRINQTELNLLGYSLEELIGQFVWKISADELPSSIAAREKLEGKNIPVKPFEREFRRKDGSTFPVLVQDKILYIDEGKITGIRSTIHDITEQKRAENELNKSRAEFKNLFDNAPVGYHEIDSEGRILRMNQTELNMLGYTEEELIGIYIWEIAHNADETHQQVIDKLSGQNIPTSPFETTLISKNGLTYSILIQDRIVYDKSGNITGIRTTIQDISERKQAEINLQLSEEKFRNTFENSTIGKSLISMDGKLSVNKAFCQIVGYSEMELSNLKWTEFTHKDDIELTLKENQLILAGEKESSQWEKRYIHKNGNIIWVDISTFLLRDYKGNPMYYISEIYDITDRKKAETDLRNSEERFKKAFITSPDSININRMEDGMYVSINNGFTRTMGYEEKDVLGKTSKEINIWNNPDDRIRLVSGLKEKGIVENLITLFLTKTGRLVYGMMSASVIDLNGISHILSITRDITEIKNTEFALQQSEELYRNLVLRIPDGVYKSTEQGKFIDVNPALVNMLGYESKEDLMNIDIKSQLYFDISDRESDILNSQNEAMSVFPLKKKDGSKIWIEDHGWYNTDSDGNIDTHEGVMRDITERKLAQDELLESKAVLNDLLYASADFIDSNTEGIDYKKMTDTILKITGAKYAILSLLEENGVDFTTLAVSGLTNFQQKVKDILGFDLVNKKWKTDIDTVNQLKLNSITRFNSITDLTGNLLSKTIIRLIEKTFDINEAIVVRINKNNKFIGTITFIFLKGSILKNPEIVELFANQAGLYIDRENSAKALRESEEKYRYLFANNPQPMYIFDIDTLAFLEVNMAAIKHYGYSEEEFLQMTIKDIRPKEDIPTLLIDVKNERNTFKPAGVWRHIKKNGEIIFVDITTISIISNGRKVRHVMIQDITEQKLAEDALKKSVSLLNATIESTADGILVVDREGNVSIFNQRFVDMWKIPKELLESKADEPILKTVENQVKKQEEFINKVKYLYDNPQISSNDQIELLDGRVFDRYSLPHRIEDKIVGRAWSFRDITLSKKAEEALRVNELKFRSITEQINDLITISDDKGIINYASPASKALLQYESEEMIGQPFMKFIHEESLPVAIEAFNSGVNQRKKAVDVELKLKRKDGSTFIGELNGSEYINGDEKSVMVVLHDITNRILTEEALRMSEDKYRTMIEYSNDLIWSLDRDGNFTFMNKVATKTTGLILKDWIGKSFVDLIFPEDLPMLMDVFQRTLSGENCFYELRFKKADESILTISVNTSPIYSKGNIEGVVSFGRDITIEKLALQSLSESEELYRNLVLRIPDGVYKSTTDGKFVDVNPAMIQMLGYESKEEILGIDIKNQLYFESSDRESLVLQERHEETGVFRLKKKDGSEIWIEDHGWYIVDEDQNILYHEGVLRDITERKHAEEALEEKMNELIRFQNLTVGRELTMIELKKEINELLTKSGLEEKYKIVK
jgi:PAS domain S-box-containing protein